VIFLLILVIKNIFGKQFERYSASNWKCWTSSKI